MEHTHTTKRKKNTQNKQNENVNESFQRVFYIFFLFSLDGVMIMSQSPLFLISPTKSLRVLAVWMLRVEMEMETMIFI